MLQARFEDDVNNNKISKEEDEKDDAVDDGDDVLSQISELGSMNHIVYTGHRSAFEEISPCDDKGDGGANTVGGDNLLSSGTVSARSTAGGGGVDRHSAMTIFLKMMVLGMIFLAAVILSSLTYYFDSKRENDIYTSVLRERANTIFDSIHRDLATTLWTADSLSTEYLVEFDTLESWPFIAKSDSIFFAPYVTNVTRIRWEQYAIMYRMNNTNADSGVDADTESSLFGIPVLDSLILSCDNDSLAWMNHSVDSVSKYLTNCETMTMDGPGPYFPLWQIEPTNDDIAMIDLMTVDALQDSLTTMIRRRRPQLTRILPNFENKKPSMKSILLYPIQYRSSDIPMVVGVVGLEFDWLNLIRNSLSQNVNGLNLVLKNTCGQSFSFELNGLDIMYIDKEQKSYEAPPDELTMSCEIVFETLFSGMTTFQETTTHFSESSTIQKTCSSIVDDVMNMDPCHYSIQVLPSPLLKATYTTWNPWILIAIIAIFLLLISFFFIAYDSSIRRSQKNILKTAARSNAIVDSLFPAGFREQIYKASQNNDDSPHAAWNIRPLRSNSDRTFKNGGSITNEVTQSSLNRDHREDDSTAQGKLALLPMLPLTPKIRLKSFLFDAPSTGTLCDLDSEPIAELFTNTTIMFADISGFTAWSSEREPSQVFILLETLYRAFDALANRLGVFKVETIGDCYVAVAGLPDPNDHHAVIMTYFAYECIRQMKELAKELEATLGPGTSDLSMRVGLHSGPVTAGILRGEKSRFQLFGDSVNTAARMESTGEANLIHSSQDTADLLIAAGKFTWVTARDSVVSVKGKGEMQTFWLKPRRGSGRGDSGTYHLENSSCTSSTIDSKPKHRTLLPRRSKIPSNLVSVDSSSACSTCSASNSQVESNKWGNLSLDEALSAKANDSKQKKVIQKVSRLVDWSVDLLMTFLAKVVAERDGPNNGQRLGFANTLDTMHTWEEDSLKILEEVKEVILLPELDSEKLLRKKDKEILLPPEVRVQLHDYVTRIASLYRDIPFHNLEHASHVTMSAVKLMKRIINPDDVDGILIDNSSSTTYSNNAKQLDRPFHESLHESTFGISSDPLTQFCVVFSALIHDVDHPGVPNTILVKEKAEVALRFGEKSAAEQNSVYIAWEMLMEPKYETLRACIYSNDNERKRFRQLLVNAVMATDIMDQDLQLVRRNRWGIAFNQYQKGDVSVSNYERSRKATSVIEHIIQASDVAHTMQHWHIFKKWNERLFDEMYIAYKMGRSEKDPSIGWYEGQIWFFDNYIIPLAEKLNECGVFGVAGSEYLSYALENRREWELKGREESKLMVVNFGIRCSLSKEFLRHHASSMILEEE